MSSLELARPWLHEPTHLVQIKLAHQGMWVGDVIDPTGQQPGLVVSVVVDRKDGRVGAHPVKLPDPLVVDELDGPP